LSSNATHETIIVLDFGSQYTQLIARRIREAGVYCEILPFNATRDQIYARQPKGLILSGGPASVYAPEAPRPMAGLFEEVICPTLGICYGLQLMAASLGGRVQASARHEYGFAQLNIVESSSPLFAGLPSSMDVWMSHGDQVTAMPSGFRLTAVTDGALNGFEDLSKSLFGLQFHPEVAHSEFGFQILKNFYLISVNAEATGRLCQ
jgi:GMP synthase (glutamine-hydrolysing)